MYEPHPRVTEQIEQAFVYHPPKHDQVGRFHAIRQEALNFARLIAQTTPESREQSLALTKLEEAVMFANAAIARHE